MDFIRKRLQVFVSSTYSDLIEERQAAVEAILTAGHIPAGMELFTAGDESQMDVIKRWIDESDVFLLILGGRYGSVEPTTGKSYTHLEYEYAVDNGVPLFACIINEDALEDRVKQVGTSAIEMKNPAKLVEFRKLILTRMVKFWSDSKDIKISIGRGLTTWWSRSTEVVYFGRLICYTAPVMIWVHGLLVLFRGSDEETPHIKSLERTEYGIPLLSSRPFCGQGYRLSTNHV